VNGGKKRCLSPLGRRERMQLCCLSSDPNGIHARCGNLSLSAKLEQPYHRSKRLNTHTDTTLADRTAVKTGTAARRNHAFVARLLSQPADAAAAPKANVGAGSDGSSGDRLILERTEGNVIDERIE